MRQFELKLWSKEDGDPNETPFVHSITSSKTAKPTRVKGPCSVFDLATRPLKVSSISNQDEEHPREWIRDGGRITGWGEVRRRRWEESERDRKSKTIPPKTPDKARTKSQSIRDIDGK